MAKYKNSSRDIDLRDIFVILRKQYKVIVISTIIAFVLSYLANSFWLKPVYTTKAVLMVTQAVPEGAAVNRNDPGNPGLQGLVNKLSVLPELTINTYINQLTSNTMLERVVKKLQLNLQGYSVNSIAGMYNVSPVEDTNLISVNVVNADPYLAAKLANTLTNEFLEFTTTNNEQQLGKSLNFLRQQVKTTERELSKAVTNLKQLEVESGGVEMLSQLIKTKSDDLSKYQTQRMLLNVEYERLAAGKQVLDQELLNTPRILKTAADSAGISAEQPNPAYLSLKAQSDQKKLSLVEKQAEINGYANLTSQLTGDLKALQLQLADRKNKIMLGQKEVERLEQTNTLLKTNITEAQIAKSMRMGETNLAVVSPAAIPDSPFKPNKKLNLVVAVTLGLTIGIFLAFVLNFLDNTLNTPSDVEEVLGLPVLGQVPTYKPYTGKPTATAVPTRSFNQPFKM